MALSKIDVANMLTGTTPVANGGTGATSFTAGIAEVDQWRLSSNFSGDANPIASNWERNDTNFDKIGTGLSQASGIFSFANTGIYLITANWNGYYNADSKYNEYEIMVTTNNSSYTRRAVTSQFIQQTSSDNGDAMCSTNCIIDVTDIANVKFRISFAAADNGVTTKGHSDSNNTFITSIRLGDT